MHTCYFLLLCAFYGRSLQVNKDVEPFDQPRDIGGGFGRFFGSIKTLYLNGPGDDINTRRKRTYLPDTKYIKNVDIRYRRSTRSLNCSNNDHAQSHGNNFTNRGLAGCAGTSSTLPWVCGIIIGICITLLSLWLIVYCSGNDSKFEICSVGDYFRCSSSG